MAANTPNRPSNPPQGANKPSPQPAKSAPKAAPKPAAPAPKKK